MAKKLSVTFVYVDDTACSNTFGLPVISMLCRDSLNAIHAVAWGVLKNRTTEAFLRFFTFTAKFFPAITTFMCDRHHAQRKAISQVFGPTVHILHCCVHVGRNIVNNTGQNSTLSKLFWKMRYTRTAESEAMFLDALKKLHLSKKTTFSTRLFNSVDSFLPSKIDQDLKRETYPELDLFKTMDLNRPIKCCQSCDRVVELITAFSCVQVEEPAIFSLDDTNTVEGYFSLIKQRLARPINTLRELFKTINYTEELSLALHNPSQPSLPESLVFALSFIISPVVQRVLNVHGIRCFLLKISSACEKLLHSLSLPEDPIETVIFEALRDGVVIDSFRWMPDDWILSLDCPQPSHLIVHIETSEMRTAENFMMRLEPFLSISNRNVQVFRILVECLDTLSEVANIQNDQTVIPANFSFLNQAFGHFSMMSENNPEIARILDETCITLESLKSETGPMTERIVRKSIVDPLAVKMRGPQTKTTSLKVDRKAAPSSSKMVNKFQKEVLGRVQASKRVVGDIHVRFAWLRDITRKLVETFSPRKTGNGLSRIAENSATEENSLTSSCQSQSVTRELPGGQ